MTLTFTPRTQHEGHRLHDTWEIANVTDRVVVLLAVEVAGAHTYDDSTGEIKAVPLVPGDFGEESGVTLCFDVGEHQAGVAKRQAWSGVRIPPGATLQAKVLNNRELRLTYSTVDGPSDACTIVVRGTI